MLFYFRLFCCDLFRQAGPISIMICQLTVMTWPEFANAWDSVPGSSNWDPRCDIWPTVQGDGIVDQMDLKVVCDNWLAETPTDLNTPGATMQIVYT